jgi:RNase P subunit RPR2
MSYQTQSIPLVCSCGNSKFSSEAERTNDTVMTCTKCGAKGRYGDMVAQAEKQVTDAIAKMFKKK